MLVLVLLVAVAPSLCALAMTEVTAACVCSSDRESRNCTMQEGGREGCKGEGGGVRPGKKQKKNTTKNNQRNKETA